MNARTNINVKRATSNDKGRVCKNVFDVYFDFLIWSMYHLHETGFGSCTVAGHQVMIQTLWLYFGELPCRQFLHIVTETVMGSLCDG